METEANEKTPILQSTNDNGFDNKNLNNEEDTRHSYNSLDNGTNLPSESPSTVQNNTTCVHKESSKPPLRLNGSENKTTENIHVQVYKRRWYILALYSLSSMVQTAVWQTWGPISDSSERVFGWTDSTIAWLNNAGPLAYIIAGILFPWLLQARGLRVAILGSSLLTSIGCTFRVISRDPSTASILIHIGQVINGAAGPMAMGAMPYLSATWFPVHERVTATALGSSVSYFGVAVSFVLGPALVADAHVHINGTHINNASKTADLDAIIEKEKKEILNYMYYACGMAWLFTILIITYFPARPPKPPCLSAVVQRDSFWQGIFSLRKKKYFIFIAVAYGMSIGVMNTWVTVLNITLGKFDVSQTTAGWIGFYATVSCCLTGMMMGRFADYFTRMMKTLILILFIIGAIFLITFTLMFIKVIPYNHILLWVTVICGMTAVNGTIPLLFELACEMAFPTGEGPTTGVLTYLNNVFGLVFLVLFAIPNIGKDWMNWILVATTILCLPLIVLTKGKMKRLDIDEDENESEACKTEA